MGRATAYKINQKIILHPSSKTTAGVWILSQPVLSCAATNSSEVGALINSALIQSKENIPHPLNWRGHFDSVLQMVGAKTFGAFMKLAKCVEIEREGEDVVFTPTKNLGPNDGFEMIIARARHASVANAEDLGVALLEAISDSE